MSDTPSVLTRYSIEAHRNMLGDPLLVTHEHETGEWCRYSDVAAENKRLREAIKEFRECSIAGGRAWDEDKLYAALHSSRAALSGDKTDGE